MLSRFSVKKPFTVLVAIVVIIVFGVISFIKMTPDLFPNINTPYVIVMTAYPGASPEEAEIEITEPMEQQLATIANIKNVTSVSSANYSLIQLEFTDDVNMDAISVDIRDKINQIEGSMPETAGTPVVMKINLDMVPVVTAAVGMKNKSSGEVSQFTRDNLENPLAGVEGVASVSAIGMISDSIQIVLSQEKIDRINEKMSAAISEELGYAKGQISDGINAAEEGLGKISEGKASITSGQKQSAEKLAVMKAQLQNSRQQLQRLKEQGPVLKKLLERYDDAVASGDIQSINDIERTIALMGMTAESLREAVSQVDTVDQQISALDDAITSLDVNGSVMDFELSSRYSDLSAAGSTIESTVNQLQSALSEVQSSEKAALASADMTGVLTMENISAILNAQNFSMPAGYVTDGKAEILVSVGDKIKNKSELENLVLMDMGIEGVDPVRLSDIATVTYGNQGNDTYAKINGENGVLLSFTKQSSYATAQVSENIADKFTQLEKQYDDLEFTMLSDQGEYIDIVIDSILQNLLLGAVLAIIILLFFLRDIRPTLITAVSIPISVVFAVVMMYFSGVSINMISLSGLAIGVGMLVDNSIVVVENIYRLRALGYSRIQSAVSGAVQVSGAITASTLTTICVFVPIIFVSGMTKDLFVDLALTVAYSLIASLIIALTLVPAMAKGLLSKDTKRSILSQDGKTIRKYRRIAAWSLVHKKTLIIASIALLVLSTGIALSKGLSFMPSMSTPQISATIQMPEESSLEETSEVTDKVSEEIAGVEGVKTVGAMLSSDMMGMLGMSSTQQDVTSTTLYIVMDDDKVENGSIVADKLEKMADKYNCEITTSADMDMNSMMGSSGITINLYSDDLDLLRKTGEDIESLLRDVDNLEEVSDINEESTEELKVVVDKNLAAKEGLTTAQIYQQISAKLTGESTATSLTQNSGTVDVIVENPGSGTIDRDSIKDMKLTVEKNDGTESDVTLSSVASIVTDASMNVINHDNQKRTLQVTAGVKDGYNITHAADDVKKLIDKKEIVPDGVRIEYSGENEEIMDAMQQMMLMLIVGFILVYLVMVAQFQSLRSPFIVIFTIPLAFTGGMIALLICRQEVSVVAMMGFVMLMGVVVNNAIVLVDCINRFRLEGMDMDDAIISAGAVRMRPVLMTAITTVLGLIPLAVGMGTGSEMVQPVAIVCIGGLIYATLMTLVIIPVMYKIFAKKHMEKIREEELKTISV